MTQDVAENSNATGGQEFVVVLATRVVLLFVGILHQSLLAYTLLPEGRGAYALCVLFGFLLGTFFTPGAGRGSQYFVMAQRMNLSHGVSIALTISLAGGGLAVACGILLLRSGLTVFEKADSQLFLLALALIPLTSFSTAMTLQLEGLRRFSRMAVFSSLQSVAALIVLVVLLWGLGLGVSGAIIALAVGNLVLIVICILDLRRHCGLVWELPTRSGLKRALGYGLRNHVAQVGAAIEDRLGTLLLGVAASRADIGFFSAGHAVMNRVFTIPSSISVALQPRVAVGKAGRPELVGFCARIAWWTTGIVLAVFLAVSTPLVRLLLSDAFLPVVPLIWIMAFGAFAYSGADMFMSYFRGINRPEICSWATCLGIGANVASFLALFQAVGVQAAAWGMTIGLFVRSAVLLAAYRRATGMGLLSTCMLRPEDVAYMWNQGLILLGRASVRRFLKGWLP